MNKRLTRTLPSDAVMYRAFMDRDATFDGVFLTGVRSTRIFCRPTCSARKPKRENIEFFASADDAMYSGYRACLRCKPMDINGEKPPLVARLVEMVEKEPSNRLRERDLLDLGIDPSTARRQFKRYFGMSFQAYARARRMGAALASVRNQPWGRRRGGDVLEQQLEAGFESPSGYREAFARLFGTRPSEARNVAIMFARWLETPLGPMLAVADDAGLHILDFVNRRGLEREIERMRARNRCVIVPGDHAHLDAAATQMREYFSGDRLVFTLALAPRGTPFQRAVWAKLQEIGYGHTASYAALAQAMGQPTAVRAVARANGDNYRAVVIPCHRVIGSDGSLTGYGGGLARKQWLLDFERATLSN